MSRAVEKAPPAASAERVELEHLILQLSPTGSIDAFQNPNGWVVVASCVRADSRAVRLYAEGASSLRSAERVCLAALKAMVMT